MFIIIVLFFDVSRNSDPATDAIKVFSISRYIHVYKRENYLMNVSGELRQPFKLVLYTFKSFSARYTSLLCSLKIVACIITFNDVFHCVIYIAYPGDINFTY